MSLTNYGDVHLFHRKFRLPHPKVPQLLDHDTANFRIKFMEEELDEFVNAAVRDDLPRAADALIDLVYVVMGTAVMMGLPWQALWDAVQYANIRKVRAAGDDDPLSVRKNKLDVVKPPGWVSPDIKAVLDRYSRLVDKPGVYDDNISYRDVLDEPATLASEKCMICGQRYDEHDGREEHRFK